MSNYYSKCPKCGNQDLYSECQWDTVTAQGCEECGWHKEIGYVGGFAGSHYLVPYNEDYMNYGDDEEEYEDEDIDDDEIDQSIREHYPEYKDDEDDDDLPPF